MAKNESNKPDDIKTAPETEQAAPPDTSDKHTPAPGEVVVPFDKINEIVSKKGGGAGGQKARPG